jgi:YD repeat-containing protein
MRKTIALFLLFGVSFLPAIGQIEHPISLPSPNVASLGAFVDVPVSLNTGLPNISIPLFNIEGSTFSSQVALSYHAQGVRPEVLPGWVGQNWALSVGGQISRKINDQPDEQNINVAPSSGYFYAYNVLNNTNWAASATLSNDNAYFGNGINDYYDTEPDEFTFSFFGYSGRFMLNHLGKWEIQSDDNLKVELIPGFVTPFICGAGSYVQNFQNIVKPFGGFIITDGNGTRFTFGENEAIEYSDIISYGDIQSRGGLFFANSWHLTKIESADGSEVVTFIYERGPFTPFLYRDISSTEWSSNGCSGFNYSISTKGNVTSPVYLKQVNMPQKGLNVFFTLSLSNSLRYAQADYDRIFQVSSTEDLRIVDTHNSSYVNSLYPKSQRLRLLKLDAITIKDSLGNELRRFDLTFRDVPDERLFLDELHEVGQNSTSGAKYRFTYNNRHLLPRLLTKITDHWGFNNGMGFSAQYIDSINFLIHDISDPWDMGNNQPTIYQYFNPYLLRIPTSNVYHGVLEAITYPTGGSMTFEYEPNTYSKYVNSNRTATISENGTAGGLRIFRVTNRDAAGGEIVKTYHYKKNFASGGTVSSGILDVKPHYSYAILVLNTCGSNTTKIIFNSTPIFPLTSSSSGNFIAYSEVAEVLTDGSFTIYKYTDNETNPDAQPHNFYNTNTTQYVPFNTKAQERGKLLSKTYYNANGYPVKEIINTYKVVQNARSQPARAVFKKSITPCAPYTQCYIIFRVAYSFYNYSYLLETTNENYFKPNTTGIIEYSEGKQYTYDNTWVNSPTSISYHLDGDRIVNETEYRYINSISSPAFSLTNPPSQNDHEDYLAAYKLFSKNIINTPIEVINTKYVNNAPFVIDATLRKYGNFSINPNGVYLAKAYTSYIEAPVPYTNYVKHTIDLNNGFSADARLLPELTYGQYNNRGQVTQISNRGNMFYSYIWNRFNQVIARAVNAKATDIYHTSFEEVSPSLLSPDGLTGFYSRRVAPSSWGLSQAVYPSNMEGSYELSAWVKTPTVFPGNANLVIQVMQGTTQIAWLTTPITGTNGQWKRFARTVNLAGYTAATHVLVEVWNSTSTELLADEVRFHPVDAQMETYTWKPGVGVTSVTDPNGRRLYYQYDGLGRLVQVRDDKGRILDALEYNYATPEPQTKP